MNSLISRSFNNYRGIIKSHIKYAPLICPIKAIDISVEFIRLDIEDHLKEFNQRFNYFTNQFWEKLRDDENLQKFVIFTSTYFEFVKLRNFFVENNSEVTCVSEYSDKEKAKKIMK
jgi:U3 small nucleolar RNA-associated protein 25